MICAVFLTVAPRQMSCKMTLVAVRRWDSIYRAVVNIVKEVQLCIKCDQTICMYIVYASNMHVSRFLNDIVLTFTYICSQWDTSLTNSM